MPVLLFALVASLFTVSMGTNLQYRVQRDLAEKADVIRSRGSAYLTEMTALQAYYAQANGGGGGSAVDTPNIGNFLGPTGPSFADFTTWQGPALFATFGDRMAMPSTSAPPVTVNPMNTVSNDLSAQASAVASNYAPANCSGSNPRICLGVNVAGTMSASPQAPKTLIRDFASIELEQRSKPILAGPMFLNGLMSCGTTTDEDDQVRKTCIAGDAPAAAAHNSCGTCFYVGADIYEDGVMSNVFIPKCNVQRIKVRLGTCTSGPRTTVTEVTYSPSGVVSATGYVKGAVGKEYTLRAFDGSGTLVASQTIYPPTTAKFHWQFVDSAGTIKTVKIETTSPACGVNQVYMKPLSQNSCTSSF
jgi:hypothetical protein